MGNNNSCSQSTPTDNLCYICNKNIHIRTLAMCVRCNISLHQTCYDNFTSYHKTYVKCPNCNRIGSIGQFPCPNSKL